MPFEDIALVDAHAHPLLHPDAVAARPFGAYFTEAPFPTPDTLFYRSALRDLAALLGCAPDEASVLEARSTPDHARRLAREANLDTVLLDDGYPRDGAYSVAETTTLTGVRAHRILRIESIAEALVPRVDTLAELELAFVAALEDLRPSVVALKSVIAYRTGLAIDPPDHTAAEVALARAHDRWTGRLAEKPLLEVLFAHAVDWAADQHLPIQLHTGFGDRDLDLRQTNPLHLRPLLEHGLLGRSPLILLHASYPFQREAAYLASVHPNVYVDLSLVSPLLAGPALTRVLEDVFGLAPIARVLYGSDAWGIPEWLWLAARATRRALGDALVWLPEEETRWAAERILRANALDVYALPT